MKKLYKVYALYTPDGKDIKYIGITSYTLLQRLGNHLSDSRLNRGRRDEWLNTLAVPPIITLIADNLSKSDALKLEKELITKYELKGITLLNESANFNRQWNVPRKEVHMYNMEGKFICTYPSAAIAARSNPSMNYKNVNACCKGTKKSHQNKRFSYDKKESIGVYKRAHVDRGNHVNKLTLEGKYVSTYINTYEAAESVAVPSNVKSTAGDIWKVCNNYMKTAKGYKWEYDKG